MHLLVFSKNTPASLDEAQLVEKMFAAGLMRYHLLKSDLTGIEDYLAYFSDLDRRKIVLHGAGNLSKRFALASDQSSIVHSLNELELAKNCDYVFLSPVYQSISKSNYGPGWTFEEIHQAVSTRPDSCFALGGVAPERIGELSGLGFSGLAALGSIWNSTDPFASFNRFQNLLSQYPSSSKASYA